MWNCQTCKYCVSQRSKSETHPNLTSLGPRGFCSFPFLSTISCAKYLIRCFKNSTPAKTPIHLFLKEMMQQDKVQFQFFQFEGKKKPTGAHAVNEGWCSSDLIALSRHEALQRLNISLNWSLSCYCITSLMSHRSKGLFKSHELLSALHLKYAASLNLNFSGECILTAWL